jgi:cation transport ATPase
MSSKRTSRKRRKQRRASSAPRPPAAKASAPAADTLAPPGSAPGTTADSPSPAANAAPATVDAPGAAAETRAPRGYARSRAKDEQARAALKPLYRGERPTAVTVGAIAATVLAIANLVALAFGYNSGEDTVSPGSGISGSILTTLVVALVAYGMWKSRYWGVLGMQTLLALTLVISSLALLFANSVWAALLLVIIIAGAGALFWSLIKAMARIQMPERPSPSRRMS